MTSLPLGDAFARVFDSLSAHKAGAQQLEDWTLAAGYAQTRDLVTSLVDVVEGQVLVPSALWAEERDPAVLLGLLAGMDSLFCFAANLRIPTPDAVTATLRRQLRRRGRFNVDVAGLVVPRRTLRGRVHVRVESLDGALNTLRISSEVAAQCIWIHVDPLLDHAPYQRHLAIGQIPLATEADVRREQVQTAAGHPAYVLTPEPRLRSRIPAAAHELAGRDIGISAETTLDSDGLIEWQAALGKEGPVWMLAGTGPVELDAAPGISAPQASRPFRDGTPVPVNRAVLLHQSGKVIAVADKMRGYCMTPNALARYGLPNDGQPRDEGIRAGTRLVIIESNAGRFTILVCEDLARLVEFGSLLREVGVSHVLNPVIAPELLKYRWQHKSGNALGEDVGAQVITANSLAIDRFARDDEGNQLPSLGAPTLMIVTGANVALVGNPEAQAQNAEQDALTVRGAAVWTAPLP